MWRKFRFVPRRKNFNFDNRRVNNEKIRIHLIFIIGRIYIGGMFAAESGAADPIRSAAAADGYY